LNPLAAEQKRWTGPVMTSTDTTIGAAAPGEIPGEISKLVNSV